MKHRLYHAVVTRCADHVLTDSTAFLGNLFSPSRHTAGTMRKSEVELNEALHSIAKEYCSEAFEDWSGESIVEFIVGLSDDLEGLLNRVLKEVE